MFETLMIIVHVVVCGALILTILLQTTKGAGMGAAFGGASQTLFGSTGRATFLTKVTIVAATVFALTSLGLSIIKTESTSIMEGFQPSAPETPTVPELPPLPEAPAGANLPGAAPEEALPGEESAGPEGVMPPGAESNALPPLPEGPISPPTPAPEATPPPGPAATPGPAAPGQ